MRHYGITIGARVSYPTPGGRERIVGTVLALTPLDNNRALVQFDGQAKPLPVVCEWCQVLASPPLPPAA